MISFILNRDLVQANVPKGTILLDYIRDSKRLKGTKSACREGDCGSCTVLVGSKKNNELQYKAITSCITPIGNINGKHVVTIEGLNQELATPIQQALIDAGAIQCGYCTPGIVLSLTGYLLSSHVYHFDSAKEAIAGNICRCTGYKSIERALETILTPLLSTDKKDRFAQLINKGYLPSWFSDIVERLSAIEIKSNVQDLKTIVGGGTDIYVQRPDELIDKELSFFSDLTDLNQITFKENSCTIGAACKISDILDNEILNQNIPGFANHIRLIASNLIRNIATIAGNIVNASPIGDLSILFLAMNTTLIIKNTSGNIRKVKLDDFFKSYKNIDLQTYEYVAELEFELPSKTELFNFEKVSKRKYLDIASVNSAILVQMEHNLIKTIRVSVGGVSPIPLMLRKTCNYLIDKPLNTSVIQSAAEIMDQEISPISDVRGSSDYKRLLARQLFFAHFIKLFPDKFELSELIDKYLTK